MEIKETKKLVRKAVNTPKFNPNKWKHAIKAGCYPYAINVFIDEFFLVGSIIGKPCNCKVSDETLIKVLKEELNSIGYIVKEVKTEDTIEEDELKIYLQRETKTGYYHFLREDEDGIWSHKFPNEIPCRTDSLGNLIEDPDAMVESPFNGWCFKLSKIVS